jgi:hypothetical protein
MLIVLLPFHHETSLFLSDAEFQPPEHRRSEDMTLADSSRPSLLVA